MRSNFMWVRSVGALAALILMGGEAAQALPTCTSPEEVVLADAAALTRGDGQQRMALFREDGRVFVLPTDPDRLVGELSSRLGTQKQRRVAFLEPATLDPPDVTEVVEMTALKDLVFAKYKITDGRDPAHINYLLVVFRIVECGIAALWHVAQTLTDDPVAVVQSEGVIRELVAANNAGQVERFLAVFAPSVRLFRSSDDPHAIGDRPSKYNGDAEGRRQVFLQMFAKGAPADVEILDMITVGDLVVSRDVATLPNGRIVDGVSIYRIREGRITHDWYVSEQPRDQAQP